MTIDYIIAIQFGPGISAISVHNEGDVIWGFVGGGYYFGDEIYVPGNVFVEVGF